MAEVAEETPLQKYLNGVALYEREFKKWEARVTKIIRRYRDDTRSASGNETAKFNILWSNVQTLTPAVYAKLPKADVSRRFGDNDPIGRVASLLIERALDYEIEHYPDYRATMKHCVEDRFLGGRGVSWVRYEPHVKTQDIPEDGVQVTEDIDDDIEEDAAQADGPGNTEPMSEVAGQQEAPEEIEYECAPVDYVHWKDFGQIPANARTWEEVTAVYRIAYMGKDALIERFGEEKAKTLPLDTGPDGLDGKGSKKNNTQAQIYELWDKEKNKAFWFAKGVGEFIDERDDPLELEGFFPCPKPLYSTTTSDSLVPVPDFVLYQDQANELDILSDRIDGLVKALRVRGVYDASVPALQRLMTEGGNNDLIPIPQWSGFSEKGGLKGAIDLLPLDMLAAALAQCYQAREDIKAQIYEITGISDIIRGQTAASETAAAQQIKSQYVGLRLRSMQEDVALFATELLRLKAQIICTKFQPDTILKYAAADQLAPTDQQMIPQAMQLLRNNPLRTFRIDVAADSLVQIDENQMKQDRTEFLTAFGGFMERAMPVAQTSPTMVPVIVEMMKFGVGAFKQAKQIEGVLDQALEQLKAQAAQPQQPKPDPEMAKVQGEQQIQQAKMQLDGQMKSQELAMQERFDMWKAKLEASTKIVVAQVAAKAGLDQAAMEAEISAATTISQDLGAPPKAAAEPPQQSPAPDAHAQMAAMHQELIGKLTDAVHAMSAPKRVIRGQDGRVTGVEPVPRMGFPQNRLQG